MTSIKGQGLRLTIGGKTVGVASQVSFGVVDEPMQVQEVQEPAGNFCFDGSVTMSETDKDVLSTAYAPFYKQVHDAVNEMTMVVQKECKRTPRKTKKMLRCIEEHKPWHGKMKRLLRYWKKNFYALRGHVSLDCARGEDKTSVIVRMDGVDPLKVLNPGEEILTKEKRDSLLATMGEAWSKRQKGHADENGGHGG